MLADFEPAVADEPGFIESVLVEDEITETSDDLTAVVRAVRESVVETPTTAEPAVVGA